MEKIRFTSYIEKETFDQLKSLSKETRVPQSQYVQEAIDDLIKKYESTNQ